MPLTKSLHCPSPLPVSVGLLTGDRSTSGTVAAHPVRLKWALGFLLLLMLSVLVMAGPAFAAEEPEPISPITGSESGATASVTRFRLTEADVSDAPMMTILPSFYSSVFWAMNPFVMDLRPPIELTAEYRISPGRTVRNRDQAEFDQHTQYYNLYTPVYGASFSRGFWGMYANLIHHRQADHWREDAGPFSTVLPRARTYNKAELVGLMGMGSKWGMVSSVGWGTVHADRQTRHSEFYDASIALGYKWRPRFSTVFLTHYSTMRFWKGLEGIPIPSVVLLWKPWQNFDLVAGPPTVGFDWKISNLLRMRVHTFLPGGYEAALVCRPDLKWEVLARYLREDKLYIIDQEKYGADRLYQVCQQANIEGTYRIMRWMRIVARVGYGFGEHAYTAKNQDPEEAVRRLDYANGLSYALVWKLDL